MGRRIVKPGLRAIALYPVHLKLTNGKVNVSLSGMNAADFEPAAHPIKC